MEDRLYDFAYEVKDECEGLSKEIISRLCKRAIKGMNTLDSNLAGSSDDFPSNFTFFDVLAFERYSKDYDEIKPFLGDFVKNTLMEEYNKLPRIERFVLDYSELNDQFECDPDALANKILATFNRMLEDHYETRKIQRFVDKLI